VRDVVAIFGSDSSDSRRLTQLPLPAKAQECGQQLGRIAEVEAQEFSAKLRFVTENLRGDVGIADAPDVPEQRDRERV